MKHYYRRIWKWTGGSWIVVYQGYVEYYNEMVNGPVQPDKVPCLAANVDTPTVGCGFKAGTLGTPPLYEVWWAWVPATWGSASSGSWQMAAAEKNW